MIVLVMGMGRSGTSLLMQALQAAGFDCGRNWIPVNEYNPQGYFEMQAVVDFNISLLQQASGDCESLFPLPDRDSIESLSTSFIPITFPDSDFALKDPRFSLTYPVWHPFLKDCDCRVIFSRRNPEAIAESLSRAYRMDMKSGRIVTLEYTKRTQEQIERFHLPYCEIHYEDWFSNPQLNLQKLEQLTGRSFDFELTDVLDDNLHHCKGTQTNVQDVKISSSVFPKVTDTLIENLHSLEAYHPKIFKILQPFIDTNNIEIIPESGSGYRCKKLDEHGSPARQWFILQGFDPHGFPAIRYQQYQPQHHWLFVMGIDVLCLGSLEQIKLSDLNPIIIVEPDEDKFFSYLKLRRYVTLFCKESVYWFIGKEAMSEALQALDSYLKPYFLLKGGVFPVLGELLKSHHSSSAKMFGAQVQQKIRACVNEMQILSDSFAAKYTQAITPKKVMLVIPGVACWIVLGKGLAHGFRENGLEVVEVQMPFPHTLITPYESLKLLLRVKQEAPDFLLTLSHVSDLFIRGIEHVPIKRVVWYVDEPDHLAQHKHGPYDDLFYSWIEFEDRLKNHGGSLKGEMIAGAFPLPRIRKKELMCEVAFAGNIEDHTVFRSQCPQVILKELDRAVQRKLQHIKIPVQQCIDQLPFGGEELQTVIQLLKNNPQKKHITDELVLNLYLHQECIRIRRVKLICSLSDFDLKIYGNFGWEQLLKGTAVEGAYQGCGIPYDECCNMYHSSQISLNIHPPYLHSGPNQRDFDIPMCDGFLLSDLHLHAQHRMPEFFIENSEIALYNDELDLPQKVRYFLDHPEERKEITKAAKQRIQKDHLFTQRVRTILSCF